MRTPQTTGPIYVPQQADAEATVVFDALVTDGTAAPALTSLAQFWEERDRDERIVSGSHPQIDQAGGLAVWTPDPGNWDHYAFYGAGADDDTGGFIIGGVEAISPPHDAIQAAGTRGRQYDLVPLVVGTFTLGTRVGPASTSPISSAMRWADTITITDDRSLPPNGVRLLGPGSGGAGVTTPDQMPARIVVPRLGFPMFFLRMWRTTAVAVGAIRRST